MRKQNYRTAAAVFLLIVILTVTLSQPLRSVQADVVHRSKLDPAIQTTLVSMDDEQMITVIVTMRSQADLTNIQATSRQERINQVINTLQNKANATQLHLRALLDRKKGSGEVASYESFWVFNGLAVTAKANVINELAARPEIATITTNEIDVIEANSPRLTATSANPELNLSVVQAPELWDLGYTGQGIVVANLDSGVDINHPDLSARWRGGNNSWFDPYGQHPTIPTDISGHGTWTMGVMVGGDSGGTAIGLAPDAQWIAVKIFDDYGNATANAIHGGFQWLLDPDGDPGTLDTPHVVNNSWIFSSACDLEFELDLQALRAAGILPVFAAGNTGPASNTSRSPANNPSAFAVGSTTISDTIEFDSGRGPSSCGESESIFPELVAPGVNIRTSDLYGFYYNATGTSLSAPHVSGALALLLSAYPELDTASQQEALLYGATDLGAVGPDNDYGYGRLNALASYQWLEENGTPTPTPLPLENLALNSSVNVSSAENGAHGGEKAVDGDYATFWQTRRVRGKNGSGSESITIDLGNISTVDEIVIYWGDSYASSYEIELSANGNNWIPAYTTASGDGVVDSVALGSATARYVRMASTAWSDAALRNMIMEFEVLGIAGSPASTSTPAATSTPGPTGTPTPTPSSTPSGQGTIHVGDLDGSSRVMGKNWKATVTITVHDINEAPVANVNVTGTWSGGFNGAASCVTDGDGQCSLATGKIDGQWMSTTLTVDGLSSVHSYDAAGNHDLDGNSDGTSITLDKP